MLPFCSAAPAQRCTMPLMSPRWPLLGKRFRKPDGLVKYRRNPRGIRLRVERNSATPLRSAHDRARQQRGESHVERRAVERDFDPLAPQSGGIGAHRRHGRRQALERFKIDAVSVDSRGCRFKQADHARRGRDQQYQLICDPGKGLPSSAASPLKCVPEQKAAAIKQCWRRVIYGSVANIIAML